MRIIEIFICLNTSMLSIYFFFILADIIKLWENIAKKKTVALQFTIALMTFSSIFLGRMIFSLDFIYDDLNVRISVERCIVAMELSLEI